MVFADFNNDGFIDMAKGSTATTGARTISINDGDGTFTTSTSALPTGYRGLGWGDFDNDGDIDLVGRDGTTTDSPSIIRNDGAGDGLSWTEFTPGSGNNNEATLFADIDGDGDLDIWNMGDDAVWHRNDGGTTFTAQVNFPGVTGEDLPNGEGCTAADFNNDGYVDFMWNDTNGSGSTQAWTNDGDFTYTNHENVNTDFGLPEAVGAHENMDWAWGDYDNDADLDVFISGPSGVGLYRNNGAGVFTNVSTSAGVTITATTDGADWGDFDNDGDLDLVVAKGAASIIYSNDGDGTFTDVTTAVGDPSIGNAVGWIDIDNDGDLDIMDGVGGLWENDLDDTNYLKVIVTGGGAEDSPRTPIGAQITVFEAGTSNIVGYREILAGYNNFQPPPIQHFGLDSTAEYDIFVLFPSSQKMFAKYNVQPNQETHSVGSATLSNTVEIVERDVMAGLVGHWKLNEGSGSTARDASGNGNDGTLTSSTWTTGVLGGAIDFDGSSSYVSIPNDATLQLTSAMSVTAWIKGDAWGSGVSVNAIARKGEDNPNNYQLAIADGQVSFYLDDNDGNGHRGNTVLSTGRWYHVAATWDGTTVRIYVNGILDKSPPDTDSGAIGTDARPLYIGGRASADYFDGSIDDVRLYDRALNAAEVAELARGYGFRAHWKLDDGAGTMADDAAGAADGTLQNMEAGDWVAGRLCGALDFDGSDEYVQTTSSFLATTTNLTISAWFKADTTSGQHHIVWQGVGTENGWGGSSPGAATNEMHITVGRYDADNVVLFYYGSTVNSGDWVEIQTAFTDTSGWHHVAATLSNAGGATATGELFLDGVSKGTDTGIQVDRSQWNTNFRIGRPGAGTRYFDGKVDDVRLYNRVLSAEEIRALAAPYAVIDLGTQSENVSLGQSINNSEEVAGFDEDATTGDPSAWRTKDCLFTPLGVLSGGSMNEAVGINDAGEIVGWSENGSGYRKAFFWDGSTSDIGTLSGRVDSEASALNSFSEVIGTAYNFGSPPRNRLAFIYLPSPAYTLPAGINSLGTLGGQESQAFGINDSGQVVGGAQDSSGNMRPFRWANGTMTDLGTLGGSSRSVLHRAEAINSSGDVVGLSFTSGGAARAFRWNGSMTNLGVLPGGNTSWALGINDDGQIVGTSNVTGGDYHAFLWENGTLTDLNNFIDPASGWTLIRATDINEDGEIVGWGKNPDGQIHGFLLVQTCSSSGGGSVLVFLSGSEPTDDEGALDLAIVDDNGTVLATVDFTGAESNELVEWDLSDPEPESAPGPDGGTVEGFQEKIAFSRALALDSTAAPGRFVATIAFRLSPEEFSRVDMPETQLAVHSLAEATNSRPRRWVRLERDQGAAKPTGRVGDYGFRKRIGGGADFWAVVDSPGTFTVGAVRKNDGASLDPITPGPSIDPPRDNATPSDATPDSELRPEAMMPVPCFAFVAAPICAIGLIAANRRRRRL